MRDIKLVLKQQIIDWLKAFEHFNWSFNRCKNIDIVLDLIDQDLESLEALTVRFERVVDLLLMKISKGIEIFELGENSDTTRTRLQLLEKIGLITNAYKWMEMKGMRNMIVHEYVYLEQQEIFDRIKNYYDLIFFTKKQLKNYLKILE